MRRPLQVLTVAALALGIVTAASAAASPATTVAGCAAQESSNIVACLLAHRSPPLRRAVRGKARERTLGTTLRNSLPAGTLSGAVTWTVGVSGSRVSRIDFFVDGAKRWTERVAPYQFNGDPNGTLDTTALANGAHVFLAVAYGSKGGELARASTQANVANTLSTSGGTPPPPPPPPPAPVAPPPPPVPPSSPASGGWARYGTANGWRLPFRAPADQDFEIAQDVALGAKYVRIGPSDLIIQKLLANGITPIILFGGNPTYPWSTTPQQLASEAAGYASRWGNRILYECMNEVNIHGWTPDAYLPYLEAFHDAVKNVAPTATVLNDGLWTGSGSQALIPWTQRFIDLGGLNYTDLYNVHLYDDAAEHGSWSIWDMTFGSGGAGYYDTKNVRSLLDAWSAANGRPAVPIVSTESGGPVPKYTEAKQATIVTDALRAADGVGTGYRKVAFTLIYNVLDDDVAGFGLLRPDLTKRPAWDAFHAIAAG